MKKCQVMITVCFMLLLSGCAQVKNYSMQPVGRQYSLNNFCIKNSEVVVNDFRASAAVNDNVCAAVRQEVLASLTGKHTNNSYVISIDVIEHKASFTFGNWNGETIFRVKVTAQSGSDIAFFEASGRASLSNLWGYGSAQEASQGAYNLAISDLMSKLSHVRTQ